MAYQFIVAEQVGGVMKITLNRPDVLNSFTLAMSKELREALETARGEKSIRAILLTGAGRQHDDRDVHGGRVAAQCGQQPD